MMRRALIRIFVRLKKTPALVLGWGPPGWGPILVQAIFFVAEHIYIVLE